MSNPELGSEEERIEIARYYAENRAKYSNGNYGQAMRDYRAARQRPAGGGGELGDGVLPALGSDAECAAARVFYEANRERFKNYGECQRQFHNDLIERRREAAAGKRRYSQRAAERVFAGASTVCPPGSERESIAINKFYKAARMKWPIQYSDAIRFFRAASKGDGRLRYTDDDESDFNELKPLKPSWMDSSTFRKFVDWVRLWCSQGLHELSETERLARELIVEQRGGNNLET